MSTSQTRKQLFGCDVVELLHQGKRSSVYRALRGDGQSVIIKVASPVAAFGRRQELDRELHFLEVLSASGAVLGVHSSRSEGSSGGLLLEDFGARSLKSQLLTSAFSLASALELSCELSAILNVIHASDVVHRDFSAHNILLNPDDGRLKVCDFASASFAKQGATNSAAQLDQPEIVAYIAPEQTGRTNRSVDRRADFYSFGVTLYELFTGRLPFDSHDALELVHAHLARTPALACAVDPQIPPALCGILAKLLAKDPDDRYQSATAIEVDLMRCLLAVRAGRPVPDFVAGATEGANAFRQSERLYGRSEQLDALKRDFERAQLGDGRACLVHGPSGIGKSAIVNEVARELRARNGLFCTGKFEQYDNAQPYLATSRALERLSEQLLMLSAEELAPIRRELLEGLPSTVGVLTTFCPVLIRALGAAEPPPPLSGAPNRARLEQALVALLRAASAPTRTLCLFFDDLQWADTDSLAILETLVTGCRQLPVLFLFASRLDPADSHELPPAMANFAARFSNLTLLRLPLLSALDVESLLNDAGVDSRQAVAELASLVINRTGGNPLFIKSFLAALQADGLLPLPAADSRERLNLIRQRECTDNVVDLLVVRFAALPISTQRMLQVSACLGRQFDLGLAVAISGSAAADLWPAVQADLVVSSEPLFAQAELALNPPATLSFVHDRVHQMVASTLDERRRRELHLQIGRTLANEHLAVDRTRYLFETVTHLNHAGDLIADASERFNLARLNLESANVALARAACADALRFARTGMLQLGDHGWEQQAVLASELQFTAAESAFACANYEELETTASDLLGHAKTALDVARVRCLMGRARQAQFRMVDAVATYLAALAALGIELPSAPTTQEIAAELELTAAVMRKQDLDALLALPSCEDAKTRSALELLSRLLFSTFSMVSDLFPIATCRLLRLSLEKGLAPESTNGFTFYGLLLSREGEIELACRFGDIALQLAHRFNEPAALSQTYLYVHYQLTHWRTPLKQLASGFRQAHRYGLNAGSPFNAVCSATTLCICRFWAGEPLAELQAEFEPYRHEIAAFRQNLVLNWHEILMQLVENLKSVSAQPTAFVGPFYDEAARLPVHVGARDNSALFNLYLAKTLICYLFGETQLALDYVLKYEPLLSLFGSGYFAVPALYLDSLCRLAACAEASVEDASRLKGRVRQNLGKLKEWERFNSLSLSHKVQTIEAQLADLDGEHERAQRLFAEAVQSAANAGAPHEEGMTTELAARCALRRGDNVRAQHYVRQARRAFLRWGATSKVIALEQAFPRFLPTLPPVASLERTEETFDPLDFVSVQIASRAISREIRLDRLFVRLMTVLIENGGAEQGYLLLPKGDSWVVEAAQGSEGALAPTLQALPLDAFPNDSCAGPVANIVNFVGRTAEAVVLNDCNVAHQFGSDARLTRGSLLCFPLSQHGRVTAVVYLANPLAAHVFTSGRLRVLEFLSTQAAISLENARLYEQLEERVRTRTRELEVKNSELGAALERVTEMQQQLVLREKLAELGALTAGIAHQIKNPLNFVVNLSEISSRLTQEIANLLESKDVAEPEQAAELLRDLRASVTKIAEHGRRASGIVSGMALHARTPSSNWQGSEPAALIERCLELALRQPRVGLEQLRVTRDYDANIGSVVMATEDIAQVLVNIIENAYYSMKKRAEQDQGDYEPVLSVQTRDAGTHAEICFRDNGLGIARTNLDRVFVPFFTTKPPGDGTGLGLSISNDIVCRGHGGELAVQSIPGQYAEFVIRLPKRRK